MGRAGLAWGKLKKNGFANMCTTRKAENAI